MESMDCIKHFIGDLTPETLVLVHPKGDTNVQSPGRISAPLKICTNRTELKIR